MILNLLRRSARNLHILTTLIFSLFIFQGASAQNCPGNLAANSGFESGIASWTTISGNATASSDANSGNGALEIGGQADYNAVNQAFAATAGSFYTMRFAGKRDASGVGRPQALIRFFNGSWQQITARFEEIESTNYESYTLNIKAPSDAVYVAIQFTFAAGATSHKLWVDDVCFIRENNNPNCSISAQAVNLTCDNNGTEVNQLDDRWTADITVSGSNTASGWVRVNSGFNFDHGLYNVPFTTESFRIAEGVKEFKFTDAGNENCEVIINVSPPPTCSNSGSGCDIDLALTQPICNNNGTPNNPLDDTYTFDATFTGTNTGSGWTSSVSGALNAYSGNYNTPTTIGPINVYNSQTTWFGGRDVDSNSPCSASQSINGPVACSNGNPNVCPGSLLQNGGFSNGLNGWQISEIDFNGGIRTGIANVVSGGTFGQGVEICNDTQNSLFLSYIYQEFAVTPGPGKEGLVTWNYRRVSGDGNAHVRLYFEDAAGNSLFSQGLNPGFQDDWNTFSFSRGIPENATKVIVAYGINQGAPTSTGCVIFDELCFQIIGGTTPTCNITATATPSTCTNNGTPNNPNDDRYNITIDATATGGSAAGYSISYVNNVQNNNFNGVYGTNTFIGQNAISEGPVTLTLTDKSDSNCRKVLTVTPPATCSGGTGGNGGDLKLTATGAPANIAAWQFGNSTFTLTNEGTQSVSGIQVSFDLHASAKLKGGDEYDASKGTLQSFWTQTPVWQVGSLAPGQTETIQLNIFTLGGGEMPIYGQVSAASGNDPDSSPNNGNAPTPNEDDEAVFTFNGSGNPTQQPDLRLSTLSINNAPSAGEVLNYNFNVINGGNATASGNYNIKAYISTDNVLSNNDIQDGIVPTGNTPVGTIATVPGASTLPGNLSQGNYFLILKIDADNQITESNEGNNTVSAPFTIGGGSNNGVDLELSFAPLSDPDPAQWGFFGTTLTLTNNGTAAASGVQVRFEKADEVTYRGGDEFTASQGDFQYWGNEIWTVGNLAAGQSATLAVNYFRLSANPFTAFAQVSAMNGSDADSTPGNGTCCNASEDDEASVAVGSGAANAVGNRTLLEDNIGEREGFAILNAAPNPFSDNLNLNVFSNESRSSELMIFDVLGKPVLRQAVDLTEGHNELSIDATELPSGFLIVKMSPEHKYLRQVRVMKLRD